MEVDEGTIQTLIPVGASEECNGALVLDELQEVLVVLNGLLCELVIHGR